MTEEPLGSESEAAVSVRWPELLVAAFLMLLALLVVADSLRVGIGWAEDGPKSGYFPFYIGLFLLASSAYVLIATLLHWRKLDAAFVRRDELSGVLAVLWPTVVYVFAIIFLGIYASSIMLIGYFMRRHGKYAWLVTALVSVGVALTLFMVFERWFLVPLPKGPIEQWLGF